MNIAEQSEWYVIGYLRTVPDSGTFIFPVVQNADVAVGRAYYSIDGTKLQFIEPDSHEALIRISPIQIPGVARLEDVLPLYGYEFERGKVWLGDALRLSRELLGIACMVDSTSARSKREIVSFISRVIEGKEFIARREVLLQGVATLSEGHRPADIEMIEEFDKATKILVMGVGNSGGAAIDHMISQGLQGVEFIVANTDAQALNRSSADFLLQLGTKGLGVGSRPEQGKASAEESVDRIRDSLRGAHMVFITTGMGGGTGTGAAPVIARVAKEMGILTVGVVTKPFEFEGNRRMKRADAGLTELEANVDSLIVVLNEKLLEVMGDHVTQELAFAEANDVLKNAIGGISEIMHIPGLVNVDFEDVKTVMSEPGKAMMGTAVATGPERATKAADAAVACPLLEGIELSSARGMLVLIAASKQTFKLAESRNAMTTIRRYAADDAHVIFGTAYDESLGDKLRVTVIATGLAPARRAQMPISVVQNNVVQRTGTDNGPTLSTKVSQLAAPAEGQEYAVPSVWRTNRTQAAARVDPLASNGMEEIEIPAFLRRQGD